MTDQAQKLWGPHMPAPPLHPPPCSGSGRQSSANIDFEMLISRLQPFTPSSQCDKANSAKREKGRIREEMPRTAGAHSFSLERVPARMLPELSSDLGPL